MDTGPDLREQALRHQITRVDAVVYTHYHADHTHGIDDLRAFNFLMRKPIPCYAYPNTVEILRRISVTSSTTGTTAASSRNSRWRRLETPFRRGRHERHTLRTRTCRHDGDGPAVGDFAYATDCNAIPEKSMEILKGVRVLILDALRHREHPSHFTVAEALEIVDALEPEQTYFTHTNFELEYHETNRNLPSGVELAYDGLSFEVFL